MAGTSHRFHPDDDDPSAAILFDNCARCFELAERPELLDDERLRKIMRRAYMVERQDADFYRTGTERAAGAAIWGAALAMNRITMLPLDVLLGIRAVVGALTTEPVVSL